MGPLTTNIRGWDGKIGEQEKETIKIKRSINFEIISEFSVELLKEAIEKFRLILRGDRR